MREKSGDEGRGWRKREGKRVGKESGEKGSEGEWGKREGDEIIILVCYKVF